MEYSAISTWWYSMKWCKQFPEGFPKTSPYGPKSKMDKQRRAPIVFERPQITILLTQFGRVFFDEVQHAKNHKTDLFKGCCMLKAKSRILLTGTPFSKDYMDLYSYLPILGLEPFNNLRWFKHYFIRVIKEKEQDNPLRVQWRSGEERPFDTIRNAFLFLALNVETVRRVRRGSFDGVSLSAGFPEMEAHGYQINLDDGTKYGDFFQHAMQEVPPGYNGNKRVLDYIERFFHWNDDEDETPRDGVRVNFLYADRYTYYVMLTLYRTA